MSKVTGPETAPRNPGRLLPTLPGMTHGIVGMHMNEERRRNVYTIQCDGCFALETPTHLVLMQTKFNFRGSDRRRLCPTCQTAAGWNE